MRNLIVLVAACGVLATAAPAFAVDFCVAPNTTCGGQNVGDLQTALDWSAFSDNADRIFLGDDTYYAPSNGFTYDLTTGPVEIIGDGVTKSILTGPINGSTMVLKLIGAAGTSLHDVQVVMPDNIADGANGIFTNGQVAHISLVESPTQTHGGIGVNLDAEGTLEDSKIWVSTSHDTTAVGMNAHESFIRNSSLTGRYGVVATQGGTIDRTKMYATQGGVTVYHGNLVLRQSEIAVESGAIGIYAGSGGSAVSVDADGIDLIGLNSQLGPIVGIRGDNTSAPAMNVNISLTNSLMRGFTTPLMANSAMAATGAVQFTSAYSDYDNSGNTKSGAKSYINESHISNVGDTGFAPGDYETLLPNSPLIDAGDPSTPQGLDLKGDALVTDGNGDGTLRRDIGAVEFQPAPVAPVADPVPDVTPPADPGTPATPSVADKTAPLVTGLKLREKRFRFRLSEPATVRIRLRYGRHVVKTLVRHASSGANRVRLPKRMHAGRYSAIVTATDTAGNRSVAKRLRFRLTR